MMKRTVVRSFAVLTLATMEICALAGNALAADNDKDKHSPVVGSWQITVSFSDGRPSVSALYTFNSDETFTMAGSWPGQFGSGHGAWTQAALSDRYTLDLTFFRLLYTPVENEATGVLAASFNGTLKVQARLALSDDGQSVSGPYLLTNFDSSGNVRSTTTGELSGSRIVVEPLP
jgi:hypothetical protein